MSNLSIIDTLDPDLMDRLAEPIVNRRDALKKGTLATSTLVAGLTMASVPIGLAALSRQAFGQGSSLPQDIINVLNFALTLEYLESTFYNMGNAASNLIPSSDAAIFTQIAKHENEHVAFLQATLGASAVTTPTFDFSGGSGSGTGPYGNPFANYTTFKALSQAFEDTGVRAYKGQAANLQSQGSILTAALQIHSVEARHACEVRRLRGSFADIAPNKGWITGDQTDVPGGTAIYAAGSPASSYPDENNTTQGGVDLTTLNSAYTAAAVSEAFDEPLDKASVLAIAGLFINST